MSLAFSMRGYSMKKIIALSIICALLSACGSKPEIKQEPIIKTVTIENKRPPLILPNPDVVKLSDVHWNVVTKKNSDTKLEINGGVIYGLNEEDYKKMTKNISSLRSFIEQQKAIISKYKNYLG
jgi:hypothetical protein